MIDSRSLDDLHPAAKSRAVKFQAACKAAGIDTLIYCTYRDNEMQDFLYAKGRTTPGPIVTNAKAGESFHNFKLGYDFVPMIGGKPQWSDAKLYTRCGEIAEKVGLEWAGRWVSFKEMAHCQYTGGLTIKDLQAGKLPL